MPHLPIAGSLDLSAACEKLTRSRPNLRKWFWEFNIYI
jgi:hypothetical protein